MTTRPTCYNTGKVKIGSAYEPRQQFRLSDDESQLQDYLLGLHDTSESKTTKRYAGIILFIALVSLGVAYAPR